MDDQFRNRFRRYDDGASLRPRPYAPTPPPAASQPVPPPQPMSQPTPQPQMPSQSQPYSAPPQPPTPAQPIRPQPPQPPAYPQQAAQPIQQSPAPNYPARPTNPPAPAVKQAPFAEAFDDLPGSQPASRREPIPSRNTAVRPGAVTAPKPQKIKKKRSKKPLLAVALFLILAIGAAASYIYVVKPRLHRGNVAGVSTNKPSATVDPTKPQGKLIRLVAVGDSFAYTSINNAAAVNGSYNYLPLMQAMKPYMQKADVRICSQTVPAGGVGGSISGPPTFNAPTLWAKGFEDVGCNVIDMASQNMNDKGQDAITTSVTNFDGHTNILATAGANRSVDEQNKVRYLTVDGLKFAYLSYTTASNVANPTPYGLNMYSDALADRQIAEAKKNAGFIIVSMHWGTDGQSDENADQEAVATHLAADNVDVVLGNGPHVIQPVKVLTGNGGHQTLVWFSLGDFLNSKVPVEDLIGGMAVMDIDSATQKLFNPRIMPLYMHYEWTADQKLHQTDADLLARKNFQLVPLDTAADLLAKSQNNTTVIAQQTRVKAIVNKYFSVPLLSSKDF